VINLLQKIAVYNAAQGRHPPIRISKTANITKDDITLQYIAKMSLRNEVISSFVINQSINHYSFNERHVKTQAITCMTYT